MKEYDIIVIGSGGGLKIALPAAAMGLKTAIIERDAVAGTCLNRGCIPSKMLIYPSEVPHRLREARRINVTSESGARVHFKSLIERISRTVDGMSAAQAIMSANAPMIIQKAMVDGEPARGVLPSGQVAGVIDELVSCEDLINAIVSEADLGLAQLAARTKRNSKE